jgi:hypothetical protein
MSFTLKATATVALAAAAALIIPTAAQASGAGLPSGESIYAIPWTNTGGLVDIDTSGSETAVFAGTLTNKQPGATAYNATNHSAYWLNGSFPNKLYKTDITTGVSTLIGNITLGGGTPYVETLAIDGAGHGYIIADDSGTATMYSLNLTTGELTLINVVAGLTNSVNNQFNVRTIAYNPADNLIYAINDESGAMQLSTVNLTGTTVTDLGVKAGNIQADPGQWSNFAFDSAGTMWSTSPSSTGLWKATPASWITTGSTLASTQALAANSQGAYIFVTYTLPAAPSAPATGGSSTLANTGVSGGANLILGALALMALLTGAGVLTLKRSKS